MVVKRRVQFLIPMNTETLVKCNELINILGIMFKNNDISLTVLCRTLGLCQPTQNENGGNIISKAVVGKIRH